MVYARLHDHLLEPTLHARANEGVLYPGPSELLTRRMKGNPDIRLALRPVHSSDGESLQDYVRGLSPQSCYNRFLGGASELPASELARALAANGHDTLTLLVTSKLKGRETIVGEARVALSCIAFPVPTGDPLKQTRAIRTTGAASGHGIRRRMAQVSHSEFGGSGQWMAGGAIMISGMFNHALKAGSMRCATDGSARLVRIEIKTKDQTSLYMRKKAYRLASRRRSTTAMRAGPAKRRNRAPTRKR